MPWGPWPGTTGGGGGVWPGNGPAPPAVASASSAGVAATTSASDHTHALDVVPYAPSLAGMQKSGIVVQTWVGPAPGTATPAVTTLTANQVVFGDPGASGLPHQSANLTYVDAAAQTLTVTGTAAGVPRLYVVTTVAGLGARLIKLEGTLSPVGIGIDFFAVGARFASIVGNSPGAPQPNTMNHSITNSGSNADAFNVNVAAGAISFSVFTVTHDVAVGLGTTALATATSGFLWLPLIASPPTGVPVQLATPGMGTRLPVVLSDDNRRLNYYSQADAAWRFATFNNYAPTATRVPFGGATTDTLTDSAGLTFNSGIGTLNVANILGATSTLTIGSNAANSELQFSNVTPLLTVTGNVDPVNDATYTLGSPALSWLTGTIDTLQGSAALNQVVLQSESTAGSTLTLTKTIGVTLNSSSGFLLQGTGAGDIVMNTPNNFRLSAGAGKQIEIVVGEVAFTGGGTDLNMLGSPAHMTGDTQLGPVTTPFNATSPFAYLTTTTAAPTGVPTMPFGASLALVYDTLNHKLWGYDPGTATWRGVVLT